VRIEIPGSGNDGGNAGTNIITPNYSRMTYFDTRYIRYGIQRSGRKSSDYESDIPSSRSGIIGRNYDHADKEQKQSSQKLSGRRHY
jgi:hypothetical protein